MKPLRILPYLMIGGGMVVALQPYLRVGNNLCYLALLAVVVGWLSCIEVSPTILSGGIALATINILEILRFSSIGMPDRFPWMNPQSVVVFLLTLCAFGLTPTRTFIAARPVTAMTLGAASSACIPIADVNLLRISPPFDFQLLFAILPMAAVACGFHRFIPEKWTWSIVVVEPLILLSFGWLLIASFVKDEVTGPKLFAYYYWSTFALPYLMAILLAAASKWAVSRCVSRPHVRASPVE